MSHPCIMRCGGTSIGPICNACREALRSEAVGVFAPRDLAISQLVQAKACIDIARSHTDPTTQTLLVMALESLQVAKIALEHGHRRMCRD